jgi:hypothetical protein
MFEMTQKDWDGLMVQLKAVIGAEADAYKDGKVARLVAAIPYLAGSEDPDRFALANLLLLFAGKKSTAFNHRPSDNEDLYRRLATFNVGDRAYDRVVEYGLNLLALIMLSDYVKDVEADAAANKYNPVGQDEWDAEDLIEEIEEELAADPEAAKLFAPYMTAEGARDLWWAA